MSSDQNLPITKLHVILRGPLAERSHLKDINVYYHKVETEKNLYLILYDNVWLLTHLRVYFASNFCPLLTNDFFAIFCFFIFVLVYLVFFSCIKVGRGGGLKFTQPLPLRGPCTVLVLGYDLSV